MTGTGATTGAVVRFAWATPTGRVRADYRADVLQPQRGDDRFVCRLIELVAVERRGAGEGVDEDTLRGLVGKCVRVPREALDGRVLCLKSSTLDGSRARPYFFEA